MHRIATDGLPTAPPGPVGLAGAEPPLSPATIGRSPSFLELPVPLRPVQDLRPAEPEAAAAPAGPVASPVQIAQLLPVRGGNARRRVVVRLVADEELDLGTYDDRTEAVERAKAAIATLCAAEAAGEWPELDGRYLRPASIVSVDILVAGN